jgi:hypothetical protein
MNCLSLTRKRPAKGKTISADNIRAIWTNEWFDKGQLASRGELRSRSLEIQENEHSVITGMPDTRMPMMVNRMRFFRIGFI